MNRKIHKILILTMVCVTILLFNSGSVYASSINPHAYAEQTMYNSVTGGYYCIPNFNVYSNWSKYGAPSSFCTNEMWIGNGSDPNSWIESGIVDGILCANYWRGRYAAYQNSSGYHEYCVGTNGLLDPATFEISKWSGSQWSVYVNGSSALTVTMAWSIATFIDAGIESSDTGNGFNNGSVGNNLQYQFSDSSWHPWSSNTVYNQDTNSLGWTSSYSSVNNKITFNH